MPARASSTTRRRCMRMRSFSTYIQNPIPNTRRPTPNTQAFSPTESFFSLCSADYNEWILKNSSMRSSYSYLITNEYDMPEWNLANTFNYAEMSWLVCPRPFMVERGHHDGVAPDEWVAHEFARTRRRYNLLGIGDRTEIEFFNGPHTITGVGTFEFLERHLRGLTRGPGDKV